MNNNKIIESSMGISEEIPNFEPLLSQLGWEEKFVLLVGLLALYGDGEFSESEIVTFREIISELEFTPSSLIHRDPTDEELCLEEKVAWALNLIRSSFINSEDFTEDDIFELFKAITDSIKTDFNTDIPDPQERIAYSNKLEQALTDIAEADGTISDKEKELISTFLKASHIQLGFRERMIIVGVLGAVGYGFYKLIVWIF
jgi:tellurite resistance protein